MDTQNAARQAVADEPLQNIVVGTIPFYIPSVDKSGNTQRSSSACAKNVGGENSRLWDIKGKTVLFCWELGAGLGHMMQMLPLAEDLAKAGCRVYVAFRQLERAADIFGRAGVSFLQAPAWQSGGSYRFPRPVTYAALLSNVGFGSDGELFARACAWRNLMRMVNPDLIIFDHSPTALLASRGLPARRALIGSGFCCPPDNVGWAPPTATDTNIWGLLRADTAAKIAPDRLRAPEEELLARMNRVLDKWKQPPLDRLGQLYSDVDENFLTTFPELDHFPNRNEMNSVGYWGPILNRSGDAPNWSTGSGKRVFAYLKRFKGQEDLLAHLQNRGCPTIVYLDTPDKALAKYECQTLHFAKRRLSRNA